MNAKYIVNGTLFSIVLIGTAYAGVYSGPWHRSTTASKPVTVVSAPTNTSGQSATATLTTATKTPSPAAATSIPAAATTVAAPAVRESVTIGNNPSDLSQFESWLGRDVDAIGLHGGEANWSDWKSSLSWQAGLFRGLTSDILWSVPLIPKGATLDAAAAGNYDANYKALAQQFVSQWPNDRQIDVRVGWEFNGNGWMTWSAVGKAEQYKAAFRHFVTAFRSVGANRFVFEWTPNVGNVGMDPTTAYPGDDVVDIIGMDFYYDTKWLGTDPVKAWNKMVTEQYGLQWHQDFAAAHHKPTAYAEWGVNSDTAGPYIQAANKWFNDHHVLYQNYWNSNSAFAGELSRGQYPHAAATFKSTFGTQPKAGPVIVAGK